MFPLKPNRIALPPSYNAPVSNSDLSRGLRGYWMVTGDNSTHLRNRVTGFNKSGTWGTVNTRFGPNGPVLGLSGGHIETNELISWNSQSITIAFRLKFDSAGNQRVFGYHENSGNGYLVAYISGNLEYHFNSSLALKTSAVSSGVWHDVIVSFYPGTKLSLIDGVLAETTGTVNISQPSDTLGVWIGAYNWPGWGDMNGEFEYIALWERGLTKGEIIKFQENPYGIFSSPSEQLWWTAPVGPTFIDSDFASSGSSDLLSSNSSIFNFYYNFSGIAGLNLGNTIVKNQDISSSGSSILVPENTIIANRDLDSSGTSTVDIKSSYTHDVILASDGTCVVTFEEGQPLPQTVFTNDSYTGGVNGQDLRDYNEDWYRISGSNIPLYIANERVVLLDAPATGFYIHRNIPATADYSVEADFYCASADETNGIIGRATSMSIHYLAQIAYGGTLKLFVINSTTTLLGQYSFTPVVGQSYKVKLSMIGDQIKVYLDGVERIAVTDATLTVKGSVGIRAYSNTAVTNTTGWHIDNFMATNENVAGSNIISIKMSGFGQATTNPIVNKVLFSGFAHVGQSTTIIEDGVAHNINISSSSNSMSDVISGLISNSDVSVSGISISDINNANVFNSEASSSGNSILSVEFTKLIASEVDSFGSSSLSADTTKVFGSKVDSTGISSASPVSASAANSEVNAQGTTSLDIKAAYVRLSEIVSNASSVSDIIAAARKDSVLSSAGSCVVTMEQGSDGGITIVSVDFVMSGSGQTLPTIQKVFSSSVSSGSASSSEINTQKIVGVNVSASSTSAADIFTQKIINTNVSSSGVSEANFVNNVLFNVRTISDSGNVTVLNSYSIQNADINSFASTVSNVLDYYISSEEFLSSGTSVVSFHEGSDTGSIVINVDFNFSGTSSFSTNTGVVLNSDLVSAGISSEVIHDSYVVNQDFSMTGNSLVDFVRLYLVLKADPRYMSSANRRSFISVATRRNY